MEKFDCNYQRLVNGKWKKSTVAISTSKILQALTVTVGGLIFSVFVLCVLSLCSVFCVLLGANMATNVGCPQCTVRRPEVQMLGAIVS